MKQKNRKMVKVDKGTWIEVGSSVPDQVVKERYLINLKHSGSKLPKKWYRIPANE
jgi:hypothetical protein